MSIVDDLRRANRTRERAISRIAERVRREVIVPLCRRYDLRFNVASLAALAGGGCWGFVTVDGKVLRTSDDARTAGLRCGRAFLILSYCVDEPGAFGGDELGNWIRQYPPRGKLAAAAAGLDPDEEPGA